MVGSPPWGLDVSVQTSGTEARGVEVSSLGRRPPGKMIERGSVVCLVFVRCMRHPTHLSEKRMDSSDSDSDVPSLSVRGVVHIVGNCDIPL